MNSAAPIPNAERPWSDDLLDRKQYADFLTNYLNRRCTPEGPGLVVALDAAWGLGKSFFVRHWAEDLRMADCPVVFFNAWENDSSEDPVVSFMAELRAGLAPLYAHLSTGTKAKTEIDKKTKEIVGHLRKAAMPVLGILGKAALKKVTGLAVDDVIEAYKGDSDNEEGNEGLQDINDDSSKEATKALEDSLDAFFEKTLQGHNDRLRSVKNFRKSLEELLTLIHTEDLAKGPLYVFVDELDRCRPDYAIRLLEGVKHLFSVKGVVFVVSTNLNQLSKAVGAVYGPNFDGYLYLKRFFDIEYDLPEPSRYAFIASQIQGTCFERLNCISGLDIALPKAERTMTQSFAVIAEAMQLDLRSLQRILFTVEAVTTEIPENIVVVGIWLFFVAAMRHHYPEDFQLIHNTNLDPQQFKEVCEKAMKGNRIISKISFGEYGMAVGREKIDLIIPLTILYKSTTENVDFIINTINSFGSRKIDYPEDLYNQLIDGFSIARTKRHPICKYTSLVSVAGHASR